ncbi:MAG: hypothetical protein ACKOYJ_04060 [Planctomycetia bacterium]
MSPALASHGHLLAFAAAVLRGLLIFLGSAIVVTQSPGPSG